MLEVFLARGDVFIGRQLRTLKPIQLRKNQRHLLSLLSLDLEG